MKCSRITKWFFAGVFFVATPTFALTLSSPDFTANGPIPSQYTCAGKNESPALVWQNAPSNTQTFALIVDDPDAPRGAWTHWILFNIPAAIQSLTSNQSTLPVGTLIGSNSWQHQRYDGPCPPAGTHHYHFKLFALDNSLNLNAGASKNEVMNAMKNHVVAAASLVGTYSK